MAETIFKFLEAYTKADKDRFFGREKEEEGLYEMSFNTRLMLIYGASGTGKTSLVQCGLSRRFGNTRWKEVYVRRGGDIMHSLIKELHKEIAQFAYPGMEIEQDPLKAIGQLQKLVFTPVYLIFDQFEELFTLRPREREESELQRYIKEKTDFFDFVRRASEAGQGLGCHILLIIREEFIAHLWEFEKVVPSLFNYRYRIERMRPEQVEEVVGKMLKYPGLQVGEGVPKAITRRLEIGKTGIELTYLQVYLERLYQQAFSKGNTGDVHLTMEAIDEMGEIQDVIGEFLDEELRKLEAKFLPERRGLPLQLLGRMVSDDKTKKVLTQEQLEHIYHELGMTAEESRTCMVTIDLMKIIRRYEN
jgi:hypothetical protein